jgi:hypothetical protein
MRIMQKKKKKKKHSEIRKRRMQCTQDLEKANRCIDNRNFFDQTHNCMAGGGTITDWWRWG